MMNMNIHVVGVHCMNFCSQNYGCGRYRIIVEFEFEFEFEFELELTRSSS